MPRKKKKDNDEKTRKVGYGKPPKGKQFSSDYQPPNRGRKKILHNLAKEAGYNADEIRRVMAYVLTLTNEEREDVMSENPDLLTQIVCKSIQAAAEKGEYYKARDIIDQVAGKATQKTELSGNDGGPIELKGRSDEDLEKELIRLRDARKKMDE